MSSETEKLIEARADQLIQADSSYLSSLISIRQDRGPSVTVVAERMGVSPATVEELERYDANPKLSILRRYALAVGARVSHSVEVLPEIPEYGPASKL